MGSLIRPAIDYAVKAHHHQTRNDGLTPYIIHPLDVMRKLVRYGVKDETVLVAALLHDTLEDDPHTTLIKLNKNFNRHIATLVGELTRRPPSFDESAADYKTAKIQYLASFDKKSVEALVIKVADRIINVEDFMVDKPTYAPIYFEKANKLFAAVVERRFEIVERFSVNTFDLMLLDHNNLCVKLRI